MSGNFNKWTKPAYLGIKWIGGNTPPTPMVEISREEGERLATTIFRKCVSAFCARLKFTIEVFSE